MKFGSVALKVIHLQVAIYVSTKFSNFVIKKNCSTALGCWLNNFAPLFVFSKFSTSGFCSKPTTLNRFEGPQATTFSRITKISPPQNSLIYHLTMLKKYCKNNLSSKLSEKQKIRFNTKIKLKTMTFHFFFSRQDFFW